MKGKILKVLLVLMIIASMTLINFLHTGMLIAYAAGENAEENSVEFNATINTENDYEGKLNIGQTGNLYINLKVSKGSLNDAKIQLKNSNFKMGKADSKYVTVNDSTKTIEFNANVQYGNNIKVKVPITFEQQSMIDENYFNRDTTVELAGTYVEGENSSNLNIQKNIKLGWEAKAETTLSTQIEKYVEISEGKYLIEQKVTATTVNNILPKQSEKVEITYGGENDKFPSEIVVLKNGKKLDESKVTTDEANRKIVITTMNDVSTGKVLWDEGKDIYKVIYILEEEQPKTSIILNTLVSTKFYNSEELVEKADNKNDKAQELRTKGEIITTEAEGTKEQYKGYMYYAKDNETIYSQKYSIEVSNVENEQVINFEQNGEDFIRGDGKKLETNNSTYFKNISVSKENINNVLGNNGHIDLICDGVTYRINANQEANENGYIVFGIDENNSRFSELKLTTSKVINEGALDILVDKVVAGNTSYSKEELKQIAKIETNVKVQDQEVRTQTQLLDTVEPSAKLTIENDVISTINQENNNVKMYVTLNTSSNKYDLYKNPQIVVTLPREVEEFNFVHNELYAEGFRLTNEPKLQVNADGTKCIMFAFEGEQANYGNNAVEGLVIEISGNIRLNKLTPKMTKQISMTYSNENKNYQTYEKKADIKIVSKEGILTYTQVKGYNEAGETIETMSNELAEGTLDMDAESRNVRVNMAVINNYDKNVTNAFILGKLKTTYEGEITSPIQISGLEGAKVLYSTNVEEEVNSKNWTENYEGAKAYKIILPNGQLKSGQIMGFAYNFNVPENLEYNEIANAGYQFNYKYDDINNKISSVFKLATEEKTLTNQLKRIARNSNKTSNIYSVSEALKLDVKAISALNELNDGDTVKEGQTIRYEVTVKNNSQEDIENLKLTARHTNAIFFVEKKEENVFGVTNGIPYNTYIDEDESVEKLEFELERLGAGEEKTFEYEFSVKEIEGENETTQGTLTVEASGIDTKQISTISNNIESSRLKLLIRNNQSEDLPITTDDYIPVVLILKNIFNSDLQNVIVEMKLPEGSNVNINDLNEAKEIYPDLNWNLVNYDKDTNIIKFKIPNMTGKNGEHEGETVNIGFPIMFTDIPVTSGNIPIDIYYEAYLESAPEKRYISNEIRKEVLQLKADATIEQTTSLEENTVLTEDDDGKEITFRAKITNTGVTDFVATITDMLPHGYKVDEVYIVKNGEKIQYEFDKSLQDISIERELKTQESIEVFIKTIFRISDVRTRTPKNLFLVNGPGLSKESNEIKWEVDLGENPDYINESITKEDEVEEKDIDVIQEETNENDNIKPISTDDEREHNNEENENLNDDPNGNGENKDDENNKEKRTITGKVWLDQNKNGQRDNNEKGIAKVKVLLVDAKTGDVIKNDKDEKIAVITSDDGTYKLEGIEKGEYVVVCDFDTNKYRITDYQKEGIDESENSDMIIKEAGIGTETKKVGVTNKITVEDNNYENIDMGLIENEIFDMSLEKYVSKIIVQNAQGTIVKEFSKAQLAKVEIDRKQLANSVVTIEYTLNIANEGEISGYAGDIIDYMPKDLVFDQNSNTGWVLESDGNLHNTTLENEELKPGTVKTLKLTLTKTMNENNTGTVINTAEIGKATNEYEIKDIDSTPDNGVQKEDDMSTAEVIISIRTGEVLISVTIILSISILIAIAIILKKRKEGENEKE